VVPLVGVFLSVGALVVVSPVVETLVVADLVVEEAVGMVEVVLEVVPLMEEVPLVVEFHSLVGGLCHSCLEVFLVLATLPSILALPVILIRS
jgi:hypothetical protein